MCCSTINSSSPVIDEGQSVKISGVLDKPGTTTAEPNTVVTLYAKTAANRHFTPVGDATTGADGSYSFTELPTENTVYEVRTTLAPHRHTALLYEGVRDVVTLAHAETINPQVIVYLNRLSDLLFVLARVCNHDGKDDVLWVPGGGPKEPRT